MKHSFLALAVLLLLFGALVACGPLTDAQPSDDELVADYAGLVDRLRAERAAVEPAGPVSQAFLSVEGQLLTAGGQQIQTFEYADEAAAAADAALVSPDGSSVGTSMITWVDSPHFFQAGRLIVLYVGGA